MDVLYLTKSQVMTNNRRQFLKTIALGSAAGAIGLPACNVIDKGEAALTILHTNDIHSHIDPFPEDGGRYAGKGGFARLFALIKQVRQSNSNVLLLDSGDIFQGTPYFNFYGGELELKLMSDMQYDASTLGNHEFDNGSQHLAEQIKKAKFPFINSNYNFNNTPLDGIMSPYKIFKKGHLKIGVIGLGIQLKGLVTPKNYQGITYLDPIIEGDKTAELLKKAEKCDLIIALSHLGYQYKSDTVSDITLAKNTAYIDVILGGHTHTFMDEPAIVNNQINKSVIINQSGWGGINLGRIDIVFNNAKQDVKMVSHAQL